MPVRRRRRRVRRHRYGSSNIISYLYEINYEPVQLTIWWGYFARSYLGVPIDPRLVVKRVYAESVAAAEASAFASHVLATPASVGPLALISRVKPWLLFLLRGETTNIMRIITRSYTGEQQHHHHQDQQHQQQQQHEQAAWSKPVFSVVEWIAVLAAQQDQ